MKEAMTEIEEQITKMEETKARRIEHTKTMLIRQMRAESKKTMSVRGVESVLVKMKDYFGYADLEVCALKADELTGAMNGMADMFEDLDIEDGEKVASTLENAVNYDFAHDISDLNAYDVVYEILWMDFIASIADVTDRLQQFIEEADSQIDDCKAKLTELADIA